MFRKTFLAAGLALLSGSGHAFQNGQRVPAELKFGFGTERATFPSAPVRLVPLHAGKDKRGRDEERKRRKRNRDKNLPPSSSSIPDRVPSVLPPGLGSHDSIAGQAQLLSSLKLSILI
jgi:hypothetical protein